MYKGWSTLQNLLQSCAKIALQCFGYETQALALF
jgi:hypothetical protein